LSAFEFNPEERNFPIYGAAERSYPVKEPIDYRLWIVELIYVYSISKEMILDEYKEQKVSVQHNGNGSPRRRNRLSSHFMKLDFSVIFNGRKSTMIK